MLKNDWFRTLSAVFVEFSVFPVKAASHIAHADCNVANTSLVNNQRSVTPLTVYP
mgnify:CR=1 FL=1